MVMDCASAELCKYAANAMLATKISFMNEIANVCELFDADVDDVRRAVGSDKRIGPSFLFPGVGYGGSCFPKDVKAILHFSGKKGYEFKILDAVEAVNQRQKGRLVEKMAAHFGSLKGKTIALWGLAFKPRTDDMREAPAITIIERLLQAGAKVQAFDPEAMKVAKGIFGCQARARRIAAMTPSRAPTRSPWSPNGTSSASLTSRGCGSCCESPVIFDGRNIYRPAMMKEQGFTYYAIGR